MKMQSGYKLMLFLAILLLGFIGVGALSWMFGKDEVVAWRQDLEQGRKEASASGKRVFVDFTTKWSEPCQQMRETTWADRRVADVLEAGYVPVKLDVDLQPVLVREYHVQTIPSLMVLDVEGRVVKSWTGEIGAEAFLKWLNSSPSTKATTMAR
ncbi:MAG TPA: thioredoxin family protein [Tepidisphaeraceae bacterium]|jgi:thiol:disulfide interchange protein|nr:thioredoxin family protein [Tepidisphaeraceae bacterium]